MKKTRAQLYIEILCDCPNCDESLDVFHNETVKESLQEDHRAYNCDVEIICENCKETFLLTDIDF